MKLILANNQSDKFTAFYKELQQLVKEPFDYSGYRSLLFCFDSDSPKPVSVTNLATGRQLDDYDGVYINSYLNCYELAAATAIACQSLKVPFVNQELHDPPSLSKLSMYAKLAAAGVRLPPSLGGTKAALLMAEGQLRGFEYPVVLKRADADRGIDNYLVTTAIEVQEKLAPHNDKSLWILQKFVPHEGYYLISFYGQKPAFCVYRTLEKRPDGNASKAHMYKPKGGINATLVELDDVPKALVEACAQAAVTMNRQIASVDSIYDPKTNRAYVLEVNYNPQLVTIETFKAIRLKALTDYLDQKW